MKKVLIVTYDFPYPINSGGKSRIYHLMKFARSKDLEFILFSFTRPSYKVSNNSEIEKIGVSKVYTCPRGTIKNPKLWAKTLLTRSSIFKSLYYSKIVEEKIFDIIKVEDIDTVLFESFYASFYISDKIKELGVRQIFGTENIEHELYYDFAKTKPSVFKKPYMMQVERVRAEEEHAYNLADLILAVTDEERTYMEGRTKTDIEIIPNGVDTDYLELKTKKTIGKNLLFVGNFSYFPNMDAMRFFYTQVFSQLKDATLTVLGKNQDRLPFLAHDPRVKNIDHVEDMRDVYYNADVFIFPVRFGGGTNFKILEAASCGAPIIAIPDRVKGLGFTADKHYVAASTSTEFIDGIQRLFDDKKLRDTISKNARIIMEKEYDWKEIGKKMGNVLTRL